MWALPEIVVLMAIVWNVWVKNMIAIFRTALNRESSALLNMSDMHAAFATRMSVRPSVCHTRESRARLYGSKY